MQDGVIATTHDNPDNPESTETTLAVLKRDVEHIITSVEIMRGDFQQWQQEHEKQRQMRDKRVTKLEIAQARLQEQQQADRRKGLATNIVSAVLAAIAAIVVKQP